MTYLYFRPKRCVTPCPRCRHHPPVLSRWRRLTWTYGARSTTSSAAVPPSPLPPDSPCHQPVSSGPEADLPDQTLSSLDLLLARLCADGAGGGDCPCSAEQPSLPCARKRCAALERTLGMSCSDSAWPSFPWGRRERRCGGLKNGCASCRLSAAVLVSCVQTWSCYLFLKFFLFLFFYRDHIIHSVTDSYRNGSGPVVLNSCKPLYTWTILTRTRKWEKRGTRRGGK